MDFFLNRFKVVVLKSPYDHMDDPVVRDIFTKVCALKLKGYSEGYPTGVLPLDTCDFIGNHVVLCEKTLDGLKPVMAFKSVTLAKCDHHRVNFPLLGATASPDDTSAHLAHFREIVAAHRTAGTEGQLAYNGSFTVDPEMRQDARFKELMWDFTFFLISAHYITEKTAQVVALCITKFKVDRQKTTRGWQYLDTPAGQLGGYRLTPFFDYEVVPMELVDIAARCQLLMDRFASLWETRLVYERDATAHEKKAA